MTTKNKNMANAIRALSMDAVQNAQSGHPGMPMGFADVATILWTQFLKYNPKNPQWQDRDRFILSAGHGSMLLYSLLYLSGYEDITINDIKKFRTLNSPCAGHPEYKHLKAIETTTGPLGQGLANAVGMSIATEHLKTEYGKELVDHKTYCVVGDGCLMEGISQEAITLAGHLKLNNLIVLFDDNGISIDGKINLCDSTDQQKRFTASGWNCLTCNGHDYDDITKALNQAQNSTAPSFIACKTTIGFGSPNKSDSAAAHGAPLGTEEIILARKTLGWETEAFNIPNDILHNWKQAGIKGASQNKAWQERLNKSSKKQDFENRMQGKLPESSLKALTQFKKKLLTEKPNHATRVASQKTLEILTPQIPAMLGGSADLTGSNNTKSTDMEILNANNYAGRYLHYGIRELGMAGIMNGLALHGGIIAYGGTFLVFSDYARPAIRLSALMGLPVIYVMTHDSIGLGEDGPTHQPVEHLSSLRAIPNLQVFRPADAIETAEAWEIALNSPSAPSLLALSRQNLPCLRENIDNLSAKGGYILKKSQQRDVTIIASGSETHIAMQASEELKNAWVISMPCFELFLQQPASYQKEILGDAKRIFIEAGTCDSWYRFKREQDIFIGMEGFGASAPASDLYEHFGINKAAIIKAASG